MSERFTDIIFPLDHPWVAEHRIPCVKGWEAEWSYPVALSVEDLFSDEIGGTVLPTEEEVALLAAYNVQRSNAWYHEGYLRSIRKGPVDVDPQISTYVFGKSIAQGWRYSCAAWTFRLPSPNLVVDGTPRYWNLIDLLSNIENGFTSDRWAGWFQESQGLIEAANASNKTYSALVA